MTQYSILIKMQIIITYKESFETLSTTQDRKICRWKFLVIQGLPKIAWEFKEMVLHIKTNKKAYLNMRLEIIRFLF
jgi:hypothetical protein